MIPTEEQLIKTCARVIAGAALRLIQKDPHQWSTRPCSTCETITNLLDMPFGCVLYRKEKEKHETR